MRALFTTQHEAARGAGVVSLALLALFGLAFVADIQTGYEDVPPRSLLDSLWRLLMLGAAALVFFWWGQHFLLGGRIGRGSLLPGAFATVVALGGLRVFSALVFDPMMSRTRKPTAPSA